MKIKKLKIENFRGYQNETEVDFDNFTALIGKNDIGKSTIMEALEIFFNNDLVKFEKDDINVKGLEKGNTSVSISVVFSNLPAEIILDSSVKTSLESEYLLNRDSDFEIKKVFSSGTKEKIFIKALHPTNPSCKDLLLKNNSELKKILNENALKCENNSVNSFLRKAIWNHFSDNLDLKEIEIDISKNGESKSIWESIKKYLPVYSLFQADRKNSDGDNEVQDPLKEAVKQFLKDEEISKKLNEIAEAVTNQLKEVSDKTLEKLKEMNPNIAKTLVPIIPDASSLKWNDVFKNVSIQSDQGVSINKRGSGVKRLILLNFFRAQAEKRLQEMNAPDIIYAIEEPETSQHYEHQKILIESLKQLAESKNTQIIITTHSSLIVKALNFENLRLIENTNNENKLVKHISEKNLPYPSLNEINYLAFNEATEEYHNELYGYIEAENWKNDFENGKEMVDYNKVDNKKGTIQLQKVTLSTKIRHQIHHPENKVNESYTEAQLKESIDLMREFILSKK